MILASTGLCSGRRGGLAGGNNTLSNRPWPALTILVSKPRWNSENAVSVKLSTETNIDLSTELIPMDPRG